MPKQLVSTFSLMPAVASPALFDLAAAKAKVSKAVEETAPGQFKHFYASPLFDRMVTSCLVYFVDNLQLATLGQVRSVSEMYVELCSSGMHFFHSHRFDPC